MSLGDRLELLDDDRDALMHNRKCGLDAEMYVHLASRRELVNGCRTALH
jgi:hypothetical protein